MQPEKITLQGHPFRGTIYGDMGTGKTTLAMSFPKPLVIDTNDGLISVTYRAGGTVPGVRMEPAGYRDVEDICKFVMSKLDKIETIIVDDFTDLCELLIGELTAEHAKAEKHKKRPLLMENIPEQIEYLGNQQQMRRLLHFFRQTGKHVVILAGMRENIDGKNVIDVSPKMQKIVGGWGDVVGELVAGVVHEKLGDDQEHRILYTAPKPTRQAKSRFAELSPLVVDPTFENLWGPIAGRMPNQEQESD